jgi:hypothetical protein
MGHTAKQARHKAAGYDFIHKNEFPVKNVCKKVSTIPNG